jgi:mono/diheme cytochrome c family protein
MVNIPVFMLIALLLAAQTVGAQAPGAQASASGAPGLDYEVFKTRIQPMFTAKREGLVRCVQCHTRGTGSGFALQPMAPGATTWTEEQSRKNFESVRQLVAPGDPTASRLLMHPLARDAGGDPFHGGGKHWASQDAPEWRTLAEWVRAAGPASSAPATTTKAGSGLDFEFYRSRVEPILLKARAQGEGSGQSCVSCHSSIATRMRLQPLSAGATTWTEEQSRSNFAAVSGLVTPGEPLKSRLLLHPLAADAGGDPQHTGGKFWPNQNHPEWQTLAEWVKTGTGTAATTAAATPTSLDYNFFKTSVQPIFTAKRPGLVRCIQCHTRGTGSGFALQPFTAGSTTWTEEQSRKNFESVRQLVSPGDPTASRLLMHPLARTAGGDPFHGGGKHWDSRDAPEWRVLADWVSGKTAPGPSR